MKKKVKTSSIWAIIIILLNAVESVAATDVRILDHQPWRGYFGGQEAVFRFTVNAVHPVKGRFAWRLSVMERTAARGEQLLAIDAGNADAVEISLQLPAPKPGVVVDAVLEVGIVDDTRNQTLLTYKKALRLYPENPFFGQTASMAEYHIHLFDPEATTASRLTELEVPFNPISNLSVLPDKQHGILIIGESVSLLDYQGLFIQTIEAAARGMRVFYMAPSGGEIELPGMGDNDLPHPRSVNFYGAEIIRRYDKKLDAKFWPPEGGVATTGLIISGNRKRVIGVFENAVAGWPWIEFQYPSGGRLVFCGFGLMANWDAGPSPRFLLREILNDLRSK